MSLSGHDDVAFLNDVANDAESTQKSIITSIIASLKSELTCKLINRIRGSRLLISCLLGSALRTYVETLGQPRDSPNVLKALPGTLNIKRHLPSILYISHRLLANSLTSMCITAVSSEP